MLDNLKMTSLIATIICCMLISCNSHSDAENAAQEYCDCMEKNNSPKEFKHALKICDPELIHKYKLYKINKVDFRDSASFMKVPDSLNQAVAIFMNTFNDYTRSHCCYVAINCPLSTKPK